MIQFSCPACDYLLNLPDKMAETVGACPGCKSAITIPSRRKLAVAANRQKKERARGEKYAGEYASRLKAAKVWSYVGILCVVLFFVSVYYQVLLESVGIRVGTVSFTRSLTLVGRIFCVGGIILIAVRCIKEQALEQEFKQRESDSD